MPYGMFVSRRHFFTRFARSFVSSVTPFDRGQASDGEPPRTSEGSGDKLWLRPPGALPGAQFHATCTRCTACQEACPHGAIRRLGAEFGPDADTPAIIPHETPCYLCQDLPCIAACEPKALVGTDVRDGAMGTALIDAQKCYAMQGQPCDYCVTRCPLAGKAIVLGDRGWPVVTPEACAGCGVCAYLCPADAISIIPRR